MGHDRSSVLAQDTPDAVASGASGPGTTGATGPAAELADVSVRAVDRLVAALLSARSRAGAAQAAEARVLAAAVDLVAGRVERRRAEGYRMGEADLILREVSLELGMAIRVSDRTVQARMGDASTLVTRYPKTLAAWEAGRIDAGHAWALVRAGTGIESEPDRARYEDLALRAAETESVARFRAAAKTIAASVDPDAHRTQVALASADRHLRVYDLDDGMARLVADLPAPLAYAIRDRLTQMANTVADRHTAAGEEHDDTAHDDTAHDRAPDDDTPHDDEQGEGDERVRVKTGPHPRRAAHGADASCEPRTVDQLRADLFSELLLTGTPVSHGDGLENVAGRVQVTIPALALAAVTAEPALLAGYGPVDADFVHRLAARAPGWDRVFTDPYTGVPLATDRYRPHAGLIRYLEGRDERCRTPGCARPAHDCDKDHTHDHAKGGKTCGANMCDLCRRHHVGKHETAWTVRQLGAGVIEWTGPTGRTYTDRPPATVRFVPADTPPF
ncbi:MAG: DUF222 domain-containing protein [Microbacterium sp.]|uniref:HNH endonuclease signature motif containing protein n=1 Tax=Microbacterium sp. TaxID=51671 RepID=UPI0039E6670E